MHANMESGNKCERQGQRPLRPTSGRVKIAENSVLLSKDELYLLCEEGIQSEFIAGLELEEYEVKSELNNYNK
jgi:hypothetical protein